MNAKIIIGAGAILILFFAGYTTYNHQYSEDMFPGAPSDAWCNADCAKRIDVNVNNTGGSALTDYQVCVNLTANPMNVSSLRVYNATSCSLRSHWCENETSGNCYTLWINYSAIAGSGWVNNTALYYDNAAASDASSGTTTFTFFDDFEEETINETYLTSWSKSGSNPLQDKTCQNWFISVYNNYSGEDKIYLFEQRDAANNNTIEAWSFTRANASTPANWTDHGVIFTGSGAHDDGHIEPHGIFFETQSMSDAREGVGAGLGTPKWRMYYCAKGSGESGAKYSANFVYASESDLTSWTAYASNPVYDHDATYGYADSKVCIYNNKVWMHHCAYTGLISCNPSFFSYSDNGISSWTDTTRNWQTERTPIGTLVPFSTGILLTSNPSAYTTYPAHFTTDGDDKGTYSGNPILSGGGTGVWDEKLGWTSIVIDKNGSANLSGNGTYYMYYIGYIGSTHKLGLATSTTITEESETISTLDITKWNSGGSPTISSGELLINVNDEYIRSINTFQYKAMKARVKYPATPVSYHYFGFQSSAGAGSYDSESFFSYVTPDLKTLSGDAAGAEATSIYNSAYFGSYHNYEILWKSGEAKFYVDETLKDTDTTEVCTIANSIGFYDYTNPGDMYVDWTFVRAYSTPEPSLVLGSEENQPESTPAISNVVNGSINSTAQYVDWDLNQTTHNRVIYDNGTNAPASTACEGQWSAAHACTNVTDGNWASYAESAGALLAYAYFNYSVPTGASQPLSLWHTKDEVGHSNLTVPSACWGSTLYLRITCSDIGNSVTWQCDNGPGWTTLHTAVANIAYENEMTFKHASVWHNSTAAPNITIRDLIVSTKYWYQVWSYNVTNTSLSDNSSTLSFTTVSAENNPIIVSANKRGLFCNWSYNTTFANIAANLTNHTNFFVYNSTTQKWTWYNVNRSKNANTVVRKHAAIFVVFNKTTTVQCDVLTAENIIIPSNTWYFTPLRESAAKTLTEINASVASDGCITRDLYAWNSTAGSYTNTGAYSVLPNVGFAIYATTGCSWDGGV